MILQYPNDYKLKASKTKKEAINIGLEFLAYIKELESTVKQLEEDNTDKENCIFNKDMEISKLQHQLQVLESTVNDLKGDSNVITPTEYNNLKMANRTLEANYNHVKASLEHYKKKAETNKPVHNARGAGRKKKDKPYAEEVLRLRAEGVSIKELADKFNISISTVNRILGKQK